MMNRDGGTGTCPSEGTLDRRGGDNVPHEET